MAECPLLFKAAASSTTSDVSSRHKMRIDFTGILPFPFFAVKDRTYCRAVRVIDHGVFPGIFRTQNVADMPISKQVAAPQEACLLFINDALLIRDHNRT